MPDIRLTIDCDSHLNLAMQQNEVPVIQRVRIDSDADEAIFDLVLRIDCPGATPWERRIAAIAPGGSLVIDDIRLDLDRAWLADLHERERHTLDVSILLGGEDLATERRAIDVLAFNEWGGVRTLPEIAGAFSLPNHPAILKVLERAREVCRASEWNDAFSGYRERDARRQAHAIWDAVRGLDIGYVTPPASFERNGQKIRLPEQIVEHRQATCLDLAFLFCGIFEQAGLAPLLILKKEHAWVGVWIEDESFPTAMVDDAAALRKRIDLGEMLALETTLTTSGGTFDEAAERGRRQLDEGDFEFAVDIRAARRAGIRPLPVRAATSYTLFDEEATPAMPTLVEPKVSVPVPDPVEEAASTTTGRLDAWKRRLLDLSLRNRLINFRPTRSTVPLLVHDVGLLEDVLSAGRSLRVVARPELFDADPRDREAVEERTGDTYLASQLSDDLTRDRMRADLPEQDLFRRLTEIYRAARTSREESGSNTLYLALGFLEWYETPTASAARLAPILLLPLELDRKSVREGFSIRLADDEPSINVTLLEKLRTEFGIDTRDLADLPEDEHGIDVGGVLDRFRRRIRDIDRWDVRVEAKLGLFSFTKFVMWTDLEQRTDAIRRNEVVTRLLDPGAWRDDHVERPDAEMLCHPLDADSSQIDAILDAASERSFVLEGPPGTGKSQTIANLIAHLLHEGRRVLFVAEKMAALDVVHRRLEGVGLGSFCLEIHSNRSSKKQIIDEIGRALVERPTPETIDWSALRDRREAGRAILDRYVSVLHDERPIGGSVRDVMTRVLDIDPAFEPSDEFLEALDGDMLDQCRDVGERLDDASNACGSIPDHPLRLLRLDTWSTSASADIDAHGVALRSAIDALEDAADTMCATALQSPRSAASLTIDDIDWMHDLAKLLVQGHAPSATLLRDPGWAALRRTISAMIETGRHRDAARDDLRSRWTDEFLSLDATRLRAEVDQASRTWILPRFLRQRAIRARLRPHRRDARTPTMLDIEHDLNTLRSVQEDSGHLRRHEAVAHLGTMQVDGEADWAALERLLAWVDEVRKVIEATPGSFGLSMTDHLVTLACTAPDVTSPARRALAQYVDDWSAWSEARSGAERSIGLVLDQLEGGLAPALRAEIDRWPDGDLRAWTHLNRVAKDAEEAGLGPVVERMRHRSIRDVPDRIEGTILDAWLRRTIDGEDVLRTFNSTEHDRLRHRFGDDDRRTLDVASRRARSVLASRLPAPSEDIEGSSEVGILRRQMQLSRRHTPLRKLFRQIPNLLGRLKPCFLMSPLSVAQYLDPEHPPFDVVVFDEASQIPVWDAIGAIGRGAQVIVVGDSKQLPPTTFFMKQDDDLDDESDFQEVESVLDECLACGMPSRRLLWHYRSRHESLIAFSNRHYYDDALQTFPSPWHEPDRLGVTFRRLEGVYDRGSTRTNRVEAEAIVDEIRRRVAADPETSIGVVTFSIPQQHLIEDLLDEARRADEGLDRAFLATEPLFVKNLENVQGDERDVILFSICYGPDTNGRLSMAFGPLNRTGGERRLNVAVTRAREQVVVFASIGPEEIDLSRTQATGVAHLKAFLEYADVGATEDGARRAATHRVPDPVATDIADRLRSRGYGSDLDVGCSSFRIDVGVRGESGHRLGILLDGESYARARTARDRDRLRSDVLHSLGWTLHRIWAIDYWADPDREIDRVVRLLEGETRESPSHEDVEVLAVEGQPSAVNAYRAVPPRPILGTPDDLYTSDRALRAIVAATIRAEAPVHLDVLRRRVAERFEIGRITSRTSTRIDDALEAITSRHRVTIRDDFVHRDRQPTVARSQTEDPRTERDVSEIAVEELASAAAFALDAQISVPREDLVRASARTLGFARVTSRMRERLDLGVASLLADGVAVEIEGLIQRP